MVSNANDKKRLLAMAKRMRREPTMAEARFWHHVKNRGLGGLKFRRQVAVGPYIVDFLCSEERLIVEIDGGHHGEERDAKRDNDLRDFGYRVLRFWNNDVLRDIGAVLETTLAARPPHPALSPAGGEEKKNNA
ncbi:endonuclease domain-containing protein [Aestuariivirga sp.]|uniref:endonuclease domain-containing protein n=1 Tax=Aestuariivirga sp. TaxID=2650926 RepID=UPI003BAB3918